MTHDIKTKQTVRRGGRPSLEQAAKLEEKILNAAASLFFRDGYGAVSIEEIVRQSQISKRTFYARYENKAAIFRAVVQRVIHRIRPAGPAEQFFRGENTAEILYSVMLIILRSSLMVEALSLYRLVISEASRFPELAFIMQGQSGRHDAIRGIADVLQREAQSRNHHLALPELAAEQLLTMVTSVPQRRALGMGEPLRPEEYEGWVRGAVDLFLKGVWG